MMPSIEELRLLIMAGLMGHYHQEDMPTERLRQIAKDVATRATPRIVKRAKLEELDSILVDVTKATRTNSQGEPIGNVVIDMKSYIESRKERLT